MCSLACVFYHVLHWSPRVIGQVKLQIKSRETYGRRGLESLVQCDYSHANTAMKKESVQATAKGGQILSIQETR